MTQILFILVSISSQQSHLSHINLGYESRFIERFISIKVRNHNKAPIFLKIYLNSKNSLHWLLSNPVSYSTIRGKSTTHRRVDEETHDVIAGRFHHAELHVTGRLSPARPSEHYFSSTICPKLYSRKPLIGRHILLRPLDSLSRQL